MGVPPRGYDPLWMLYWPIDVTAYCRIVPQHTPELHLSCLSTYLVFLPDCTLPTCTPAPEPDEKNINYILISHDLKLLLNMQPLILKEKLLCFYFSVRLKWTYNRSLRFCEKDKNQSVTQATWKSTSFPGSLWGGKKKKDPGNEVAQKCFFWIYIAVRRSIVCTTELQETCGS